MIGFSKFDQVGKLKEKSKQQPIKAGAKTLAWDSAREQLKKQFFAWGITSCELMLEGCKGTELLSFAHVDKRKNLLPGELNKVVLACIPCHMQIEKMPSKEMRSLLESVIENRENVL